MKANDEAAAVLENTLDEYHDFIGKAEKYRDVTESLVKLHIGFDENDRVYDLIITHDTVSEIEIKNSAIRENIFETVRTILEVAENYKEE
jgi:hypothetical protein